MIKPVSTLSIIVAGVMCIVPTFGAQMTPQIQRLLDQKQEKIKKLEECEGKKQGWMIAGISTIGVTAVGVGLNIAQASKRNRLDDEIDTARHDLEVQERHLSEINSQIADRERENASSGSSGDENLGYSYTIGGTCGDNNAGKWTVMQDGGTKCWDKPSQQVVDCACFVGNQKSGATGGDEKQETVKKKGNVGTVDNAMELAKYTDYQVKCDGTDEQFEFDNDVHGATEQILRIKTACDGTVKETTLSKQYTDASGKTTTHATTLITCKCDTVRKVSLSESGIQKLSGKTPVVSSQESKKSVEKNLAMDAGLSVGIDLAIKNAQSNSVLNEENKDLNKLNSIGGTSGGINLDLPTAKEPKPTKTEKFEAEAASITQCETSGGWVGPFGGCNCSHTKGLTRTDDKKSCVCEKSGYEYNKDKMKCVGPNIDKVEEILSDDKFLKDNFL